MRATAIAVLFSCVAGVPSPLSAQTDWTLLSPSARPPMRAWMAMSYDLTRDRTVMTGGFDNITGLALGDTWEFDGTTWTQVPAMTSPARDCMAMTFAISTSRTVLFGGLDSSFNRLGDTWEFDGSSWTFVTNTGPSPRVYMPLAYDIARDRVVAFGGGNQTSFADTWEYDPQARTWSQIATPTVPPSREGQGLVYDIRRGVIVMFGGWDNATNAVRSDTWEYDGTDWTLRPTPAAPAPRICFGMVYDALRNRVVLHGGADVNYTMNFNDTWEYDGTTWTQLQPLTPGPGRPGIGMAHSLANGRTYLFGGEDVSGTDFDETWELRTVNPAGAAPFGSGCAGSAGTPVLQISDLPWIGTTPDLQMINLPAGPGAAFFVFGFSNTTWMGRNLPVSLAPFGLPGCNALVSIDVTQLVTHPGGVATSPLTVPNQAGLVGFQLHGQGLSLDPAASNGIGAVTNGRTLVVGSR